MEKKNTLVVNLFAGPGAGKSTGAAYIFAMLKLSGIDCEYVNEFAKDKVWENNTAVFESQFYILAKQAYKVNRCCGKVDVIITDSPILQASAYSESEIECKYVEFLFNKFNNMNFFINRVKPYNPNGRNQTEDEAKEIDKKIKNIILSNASNGGFRSYNGDLQGFDAIVNDVKERLEQDKK